MFTTSLRGVSLPLLAVSAGLGMMLAGCGGGGSNLPTPGSGQGGLGNNGGTTGGTTGGGTTGTRLSANTIVFVSTRDGNPEIYAADISGTTATNLRRLTNNAATDENPSRSADGSRIVFSSQRDGNSEIYVMNADGSGLQRLTTDTAPSAEAPQDIRPVFSPNGSKIVWQSARGNLRRLYIMDATGANQRPVTFADETRASYDGSWNPDNTRLLSFLVNPDNASSSDLAVVTPMASATTSASAQILLNAGVFVVHPRYSPNGQRIVYSSAPSFGRATLQLLTNTGTLIGAGPTGGFDQTGATFSPSSNRLVWAANPVENTSQRQLYVADVAASGAQPAGVALTTNAQGENYDASWTQ